MNESNKMYLKYFFTFVSLKYINESNKMSLKSI